MVANRKTGRTPLTRERILTAAVALADEKGIDSVTMRALGDELGVEAMSLYNHVANKEDLLDGMVDMAIGEIELPTPGADWKDAMRARAISAHAMFARHPWASVLIDSRRSASTARFRYYDAVIGNLRQAGLSVETTAHAFALIDSYIKGFALQQTSMAFDGEEELAEAATMLLHSIASDYPHLAELTEHTLRSGHSYQEQFEFGLDLILCALQGLLAVDVPGK